MFYIIVAFSIMAGIDKILNNRLGLGEKFDEGFKALGELSLTIIGIYILSPVIARYFMFILNPLAKLLHADPSVFLSSILAVDLGGYTTSIEIANTEIIGKFNGLILASMLGATISFTIPVAVGMISKEDFKFFAKGILAGIVTLPIGMVMAGIMMKIKTLDIIFNLVPILIFSMVIILGLFQLPDRIIKVFNILGKVIMGISTIGLILGMMDFMFGYELISGMLPLKEGVMVVFKIGIILSGAYPMFYFISRKLHRYLSRIGKKFELNQYSILGIFTSLANCIPMLGIYNEMDEKGKVLNAAFIVSGAFTFGGQLGYVSSVSADMINPFIVSKLAGGISALFVAGWLIKLEKSKECLVE